MSSVTSENCAEMPPKFYKYRSVDGAPMSRAKEIILEDKIFFASPSNFNDPFDLRPVFSLEASADRQIEDYLRLSRKFESHLTESQREAEATRVMTSSLSKDNLATTTAAIQVIHNFHVRASVGVFCVSTKRDDILMWAHYADSHKGICLEFDGMQSLMAHAQRVEYSQERVPINPYNDANDVAMSKALLTKSSHWAYEAEWRLIRYDKGPGPAPFPAPNLTGVILGAMTEPSTVEAVKLWIRQRAVPLNLYRASISSTRFELQISQLQIR